MTREQWPDELMRILTEYEGALQEDDEEVIAPAREALLSFLRPILAQMKESAPTPERAQDIQQEYYKKGFNEGRAIGRTERADAEKDAALTDEWALFNAWLREDICRLHMSALDAQFSAWQARAILAAKEKK
jgi:hypothetical protein